MLTTGLAILNHKGSIEERTKQRLILILMLGLLILRFLVSGLGRLLTAPNYPDWIETVFLIGTYLFTGLLIYLERHRLPEFHISSIALWFILLSPIVVPVTHWVFNTPLFTYPIRWDWGMVLSWPLVFLSLVFLAVYLRTRGSFKFSKDSMKHLTIALLAGVLVGILGEYLTVAEATNTPAKMELILSLPVVLSLFVTQIGLAGVMEEPLFRGFLWGYLKHGGWPEVRIWLLQSFLFGLAHIYHLPNRPLTFWVVVPLAGLVYGYIAWRTRSIAASMLAHAALNSVAWLVPKFIQLL